MLINQTNDKPESALVLVTRVLDSPKAEIKRDKRKSKLKMVICKKNPFEYKFSFKKI